MNLAHKEIIPLRGTCVLYIDFQIVYSLSCNYQNNQMSNNVYSSKSKQHSNGSKVNTKCISLST